MGFFDRRCSVSGLSLKRARCAAVLFRQGSRGAEPVWYPLTGAYDRYGCIDEGPAIEREARLLRAALGSLRAAGRLAHRGDGFDAGSTLFGALEPNGNDATLDGAPLGYALIERHVADGLVALLPDGEADALDALEPGRAFARAFGGLSPLAAYEDSLAQSPAFRPGLRALVALRAWAAQRRPWSVRGAEGQHFDDDEARFAREARTKLARWPELLDAVDAATRR